MTQRNWSYPDRMIEYGSHEDAMVNAPDLLCQNCYLSVWSYAKGDLIVFLMGEKVDQIARVTRFERERRNGQRNNTNDADYILYYVLLTGVHGRIKPQEETLVETWRHQMYMMNDIGRVAEL